MANKKLVTYAQLNTLAKGIYNKLHAEVGTVAAAAQKNLNDIAALATRVTDAEGKIDTIQGDGEGSINKALADAKADAAAKDETLHTTITGEIGTAKQAAIDAAASDADSKVGAAKTELQGKIDLKADKTTLEAEVERAKGAEAANKAVLNKLDGDVNTEGSVKKQIETVRAALQTNIDAKVAQADYDVKVKALEDADTALDGRLDTIEGEGEGSIKKALADAKKYTDDQIDAMALTDAEIDAMLAEVYSKQA